MKMIFLRQNTKLVWKRVESGWLCVILVMVSPASVEHQKWSVPESFRTMPRMGSTTYEFQERVILRATEKNHEQEKDSVRMLLGCDDLDCICEV